MGTPLYIELYLYTRWGWSMLLARGSCPRWLILFSSLALKSFFMIFVLVARWLRVAGVYEERTKNPAAVFSLFAACDTATPPPGISSRPQSSPKGNLVISVVFVVVHLCLPPLRAVPTVARATVCYCYYGGT